MTPEAVASSAVLALNQGLYSSFLAAGLFWGLMMRRVDIKAFFLSCVIVAGVFGGITVKVGVVFAQGGPALSALVLVLISSRDRAE